MVIANNKESLQKKWPIDPDFLSIRAGSDRYDETASPNENGLFYANELRGILADASAEFWEGEDKEVSESAILS